MGEIRADRQHATGGLLWGARRVRAKVSLRELAAASGINKGLISMMEHGRVMPTSAEYDRIVAALDLLEKGGTE